MPTYVYRCENGHTLEDFEPMTAPTTRVCQECTRPHTTHFEQCDCVFMRRVIGTGGGVLWKGGPPTRKFGR